MPDHLQTSRRSAIVNPAIAESWEALADGYSRYLGLSHKFLREAQQALDRPETVDWLAFLEERDDILLNADISWRRLNEHYRDNPAPPSAGERQNQVAGQLREIKALEEQLADLLNGLVADLRKTLDAFNKGRAVFKGYGQAKRRKRPSLFKRIG